LPFYGFSLVAGTTDFLWPFFIFNKIQASAFILSALFPAKNCFLRKRA